MTAAALASPMRTVALMLFLVFAGCASPEPETALLSEPNVGASPTGMPSAADPGASTAAADPAGSTTLTPLPEPIHAEERVDASVEAVTAVSPPPFLPYTPCATPAARCFTYPFTLARNATASADVVATGLDYDLYWQPAGERRISLDRDYGHHDFPAGDHSLLIVADIVVNGAFTLDLVFRETPPQA